MSAIFQQGQELDSTGLAVKFTDAAGNPLEALEIRYSIYNFNGGTWVSLEDMYRQNPETVPDVAGKYWVNWEIPNGQTIGGYQIRWDFRNGPEDLWKQKSMNFEIVRYATTSPVRTAELSDLEDTPIIIVR